MQTNSKKSYAQKLMFLSLIASFVFK